MNIEDEILTAQLQDDPCDSLPVYYVTKIWTTGWRMAHENWALNTFCHKHEQERKLVALEAEC